jgi:hypothetical protein
VFLKIVRSPFLPLLENANKWNIRIAVRRELIRNHSFQTFFFFVTYEDTEYSLDEAGRACSGQTL